MSDPTRGADRDDGFVDAREGRTTNHPITGAVRGTGDEALPTWASAVPPEARGFQGHRAGFATRCVAAGIDFAAVGAVLCLIYAGWAIAIFVVRPASFTMPTVSFPLVLAAGFFVAWLSFTAAWATTGRTVGGHVMGIRVVGHTGAAMRLPWAALRAAFCLAFMPGLVWVIVSRENRSLQDTLMRTSVIYDWTKRAPGRPGRGAASAHPGGH
jgi:uncharacterized RDD family membrane protein YckC